MFFKIKFQITLFLFVAIIARNKTLADIVKFKNVATGKYLDSNANGNVYALDGNGGNYQKWIIESFGEGIRLRNLATNRVLDSNTNGDVYTLVENDGDYQVWSFFNNQELINLATDRALADIGIVRTFNRNEMANQKWIQEV